MIIQYYKTDLSSITDLLVPSGTTFQNGRLGPVVTSSLMMGYSSCCLFKEEVPDVEKSLCEDCLERGRCSLLSKGTFRGSRPAHDQNTLWGNVLGSARPSDVCKHRCICGRLTFDHNLVLDPTSLCGAFDHQLCFLLEQTIGPVMQTFNRK